jgi:hypothetical protein
MAGIKAYLNESDVVKVYAGTTEVTKIYQGTNLIKAAGATLDPDSDSQYGVGSSYTTQNYTVSGGGTIWVGQWISATPTYFECEWYKNNVYQGYLIVGDGSGGYYLGPDTISVADGDDIKFRFSMDPSMGMSAIEMRQDDASGTIIFQGVYMAQI